MYIVISCMLHISLVEILQGDMVPILCAHILLRILKDVCVRMCVYDSTLLTVIHNRLVR